MTTNKEFGLIVTSGTRNGPVRELLFCSSLEEHFEIIYHDDEFRIDEDDELEFCRISEVVNVKDKWEEFCKSKQRQERSKRLEVMKRDRDAAIKRLMKEKNEYSEFGLKKRLDSINIFYKDHGIKE